MRDLMECQAEVFRRSEKRIKARKQRRNHVLAACVPLVLCGILFFAPGKPAVLPEDTKEPYGTVPVMDDWKGENAYSYTFCSIAKIEVSGAELFLSYTEPDRIQVISDQLYACDTHSFGSGGLDAAQVEDDETNDASGVISSESVLGSANAGYTITLVLDEGGKTEYHLVGNALKNLTTGQVYDLSQNQTKGLKELLGIPIE